MELRLGIQVLFSCIFYMRLSSAIRCSTRVLRIKNGDYTFRSSNSVVTFTCNPGFTLLGDKTVVCYGASWSSDPPLCIANTCPKIDETQTMKITKFFDGAMLKFSCTVMHKLEGDDKLICDGTNWDHDPPVCKVWSPPTQCDFEDPELCGWSHHDEDEQEWRWHTGATKTTRTGPRYDHTLGEQGTGHYMYFETSSPVRKGHQAWLSSPLYPKSYSGSFCFHFWYHSLGEGSISVLEVFIKPEVANLTDLSPVFHLNTSVGESWQKGMIPITVQNYPFQIFFVATRGSGYRSDIAIDDVMLQNCAGISTSSTPTTETTTASTRKTTTLPSPTTTTINRPITSLTMLLTTTMQTSKTTEKPQTITTTINKTTMQAKTTKKNPQSTTIPQRTTREPTIQSKPITKVSTILSKPTTAVPTIESKPTTIYDSTIKQSQDKSKNITKTSDSSSASKIAYILIGVGVCIFVAAGIGIGLYIYRKRRNKYVWTKDSSFASDNPLYRVVADDEAAVHFANLTEN